MHTPPLIVIVGETASGKSGLAMYLAEQVRGEIISADATTVYSGLDIGSAKPSDEEMSRILHHLINVVSPDEAFSASIYKQLANQAIEDIDLRGSVPIMVGGSGLYVDSVLFDFDFLPPGPAEERIRLNTMTNDELRAEANKLGYDIGRIDASNNRRLVRLIETHGKIATRKPLRDNTIVIGLSVAREKLETRIRERVDSMFAAGLEHEVQVLARAYGWECESMQAIGYREFRAYFANAQTLEQTRELIIKDTLHLAKKQRTWFRRNKSIHWVADRQEAVDLVTTLLNNYRR